MNTPTSPEPAVQRVGPLELFFDLVFVFAVTQVTSLVAHPHDLTEYAKAALLFFTLMWMYDGFAWLTSNVQARSDWDYWLIAIAMSSFMVMSLAIPTIFGAGGLVYGVGLLIVVVVHAVMFRKAPNASSKAIVDVVPYNLGMAGLVVGAAFVPENLKWPMWIGAVAVPVIATLLRREGRFELSPAHFVERHGLLVIVALGEGIVGIGAGARDLPLNLPLLAYVVLGLYLGVCIWATYFDEDAEKAEYAMIHASPKRRSRMALLGFGYAHYTMIAGIVLTAAGLEVGVHHPLAPAPMWSTWNLAAGLALYLAGDIAYRKTMSIGPNRFRFGTAILMFATGLLGTYVCAIAQLAACCLLGTALWVLDED
jgi:low temperature requirement protein LtrA